MSALDEKKMKQHFGIAICIAYAPDISSVPEYRLGLMSNYGTLSSGDFLWHCNPTNVQTSLQRFPMMGQRFDFLPGSASVILIDPGKKSGRTCSLAALREAINVYSKKGTRSMPLSAVGMMSAEWETYRENNRSAGLRSLVVRHKHSDDGNLIKWLETIPEFPGKFSAIPPKLSSVFSFIETLSMKPINHLCEAMALMYAGEELYMREALEWKARQMKAWKASVRVWRLEGTADFDFERGGESDTSIETLSGKKRPGEVHDEVRLNSASKKRMAPPSVLAQGPVLETRVSENKCDAISRLAMELKGENESAAELRCQMDALRTVVASKTSKIKELTVQLASAKEDAEKLKTRIDYLQSVPPAPPPALEKFILSRLSGCHLEEASLVHLFMNIPIDKRLEATMALEICIGEEKTLDILVGVMFDGVEAAASHLTMETIAQVVMRVLPIRRIAQKLAHVWDSRDAAAVKAAVKEHVQEGTLVARALKVFLCGVIDPV